MIEVVLDTNVLVAAFRSSLGASYRLLQTLVEYAAVLKRGAMGMRLELADIDDFVDYLCSRSRLVQIYLKWRPASRDPNDDRILEVAVRTQSAVVTFNAKDFVGAGRFGIKVVRRSEMVTLVGGLK